MIVGPPLPHANGASVRLGQALLLGLHQSLGLGLLGLRLPGASRGLARLLQHAGGVAGGASQGLGGCAALGGLGVGLRLCGHCQGGCVGRTLASRHCKAAQQGSMLCPALVQGNHTSQDSSRGLHTAQLGKGQRGKGNILYPGMLGKIGVQCMAPCCPESDPQATCNSSEG